MVAGRVGAHRTVASGPPTGWASLTSQRGKCVSRVWSVDFGVADAAAAKVTKLGSKVETEPNEFPGGSSTSRS
jgi:hypothetical protein